LRKNKIYFFIRINSNNNILILISEIEHGNKIKELLDKEKIENTYMHGETEDREIKPEMKVLIGSNIFNEGIDLKYFNRLILACGGKSSIAIIQKIGRVLRPKQDNSQSIVYDFVDRSRYLNKHYKKRREIMEKDFEVLEIEIL
jgi:superfamily II DNA or RNA helicase